tara:strand:- start:21791 stop:21991 length:201 start_codon:yes stop_codon:yes gene_type:complete
MKINEKISHIKKTIQEIKNISENSNIDSDSKVRVRELNNEILKLKEGIVENINELEEILEDENARS